MIKLVALTHRTVPAVRGGIITVKLLRIAGLKIFATWRLDMDKAHAIVIAGAAVCLSDSGLGLIIGVHGG